MTSTYVVTASGTGLATASCHPGDFVTGGGYTTTTADGVISSNPNGSPPTSWTATTSVATQPITAFVVCATP
ncbi:hypothetical protein [Streptomyces sp. NPDC086519]|uniref:hypothetical protein n=1 Tax=Streptomyces sp. NPDC086519 TaxID=3154863 RepID=UPI0034298275